MSLKENVSYIKDEISTEEKFFENFFKIEKFYKKYKLFIIGGAVVILGYFISSAVISYLNEQNTIKANEAYNKVLVSPNDKNALDTLKQTNQKLYEIAIYQISKDKSKTTNVEFLKEIALFNQAIEKSDIKALDTLILNPKFLLKDFALFNKALILIEKQDYKKAKKTINIIDDNSPINSLVVVLKHFLVTK